MSKLSISPGLSLYYEEHNPGGQEAVLLLHGLGATTASWQLQIPALVNAGLHTIAVDARGFGNSTYPGGGTSIAEMAGDFYRLLQELHCAPAHVVGISMGGTHALQFALDYPQSTRKLVLINTFARLRPGNLSGWFYFALRFLLVHSLGVPYQARTVARRLFPDPEQAELRQALIAQIEQADPTGYRAAMRALARFDVQQRLAEIHLPTLVITASNDTTVPPAAQKQLASGISGARHEIIQGAGHALTVEKPELVNKILVDFLKSPP
ncbi:MAG: alpha/beta fold hydrolase [Anaerolineales bacterium]